jgi:catechol 2,3-dioxygenase-like lactoylglutathione lyase family enzyme
MMAIIRYIAFISEKPDELAKFYNRFLGTRELGRSVEGDISISDGFYNLTFFKRRPNLHEPRMEVGLNHIGLQVESLEEAKARYLDFNPRGTIVTEAADLHHGEIRIHDIEGNPVTLAEKDFAVGGIDRSLPGVRHIAYNTHDPEGMRQFYSEVLGLREVHSSYTYRRNGKLNRFVGDSCTNLALHPFYNSASPGHEMKFGINHIGFLVRDLKATMDDLRSAVSIQKRPDDRPYAEFRLTDPDGNRLDLSQDKGWEVDLNKWETVA